MPERRERILFAGGVVLLLGAATLAWWLWLGRRPVPAAPARPAPRTEPLTVVEVSGRVQLRRPGASGPMPLRGGEPLQPDDEVETGPGAAVQLAAGESYRVDLEENSRFAVREITAELGRFRLAGGLMSARVRDDPARVFEVEAGPEARARTRGGELSVAAGEGGAEVAVRRGQAEVVSAGRTVVVRAGQRTLALPGAAPTPASPIPESLLLEVNWPRLEATNQRRLVVTGRTAPGALLAVGGRPVLVGPDGTFRAVVHLKEGPQKLGATARDASGHRRQAQSSRILLDTRGVPAEFDTDGLWGNEGKAPTGGRKPSP